jgi:molybdate transport system substrate-binding protein
MIGPILSLLLYVVAVVPTLSPSHSDEIRVAAASNFSGVITVLAKRFEGETGHRVVLSFGSTGKHHAQITNGAPFDAFFAADTARPQRLEEAGIAIADSRFTYAAGRIVLWSPQSGYVDSEGKVLATGDFRHLAIANPLLAPYGRAAQEVLEEIGLWTGLAGRLVRGENISQTFQFVHSGNAELGFVAYAQVRQLGLGEDGSLWDVPRTLYTPIEQQAVLLTDNATARAFLSYVRSDEARTFIRNAGYDTP